MVRDFKLLLRKKQDKGDTHNFVSHKEDQFYEEKFKEGIEINPL